jgi:hypothetical protein
MNKCDEYLLKCAKQLNTDGYLIETISNVEYIFFFTAVGGCRDWLWQTCLEQDSFLCVLPQAAMQLVWWYAISCAHGIPVSRNLFYCHAEVEYTMVSYHFNAATQSFMKYGGLARFFSNKPAVPTLAKKLWITAMYHRRELCSRRVLDRRKAQQRVAAEPYDYSDFVFGRFTTTLQQRFELANKIITECEALLLDEARCGALLRQLFRKRGLYYYSFDGMHPIRLTKADIDKRVYSYEGLTAASDLLTTSDAFAIGSAGNETSDILRELSQEFTDFEWIGPPSVQCAFLLRFLDLSNEVVSATRALFNGVLNDISTKPLYEMLFQSSPSDTRASTFRSLLVKLLPPDVFSMLSLQYFRTDSLVDLDMSYDLYVDSVSEIADPLAVEFCRNILVKEQ